jgi:hypothetical protein
MKDCITIFPSGSIAEAQEWELKIIAVQEWLTEQDMLITSHLDHDLTVDDLPDETQVRNLFQTCFSLKKSCIEIIASLLYIFFY